jgi:Protein of unknown function (DUF3172)
MNTVRLESAVGMPAARSEKAQQRDMIWLFSKFTGLVFDCRFNVYVSQPEVKPGCVLRRSNVGVLERNKLVTPKEVNNCKMRMNTFAFVGDLENSPEVSCVYHSEEAENQFLKNPQAAAMGDGYRPKPSEDVD